MRKRNPGGGKHSRQRHDDQFCTHFTLLGTTLASARGLFGRIYVGRSYVGRGHIGRKQRHSRNSPRGATQRSARSAAFAQPPRFYGRTGEFRNAAEDFNSARKNSGHNAAISLRN
jgi:hypothetical protein